MHDLICFLNTLTDDYQPDAPLTALRAAMRTLMEIGGGPRVLNIRISF